ncbi:MAG TPA: hypothetical protein VIM11_26700 [Tepidisphaeraceae bacterium]
MTDTTVTTAAPEPIATITTSGTSGIASAAAVAEKVVEAVAKVEGPILTGVSLFVPGAAVVTVPLETILPLILPDIEKALNDIAQGNMGDIWQVGREFVQHITSGQPNSSILSTINKLVNAPPAA